MKFHHTDGGEVCGISPMCPDIGSACYECFYPLCLTTELCPVLPNFRKRKTLQSSKKITTLSKSCSVLSRTFLFALFFDFGNLFCRCAHNPYACIAHTVKERVKLPPLRVFFRRRFQKELVYGYIVAEHKLKENLQTWVLPLVLNVRKVARRNKHFVAYFLAALLAPCPRRLYRCPKSLEVVFRYWSFAIFIHPITFYCSPFFLDMSTLFYQLARIVYIIAMLFSEG